MRTIADLQKWKTRLRSCTGAGFLLLLLQGCPRDLTIPDPPPPVSARVRVTVTLTRPDPVKVSVHAQQTLDENGNPASGVIPEDDKTVQQVSLGQTRSVEFDFPNDATLINSGTWNFSITVKSVVGPGQDESVWQTTCTTNLRKDGLNNLQAIESTATCTGDFVNLTPHDVGIGDINVEPAGLRVGDKANITFAALNNGESPESFTVTIKAFDPTGSAHAIQDIPVSGLASGADQVIPLPNDPPITWDTKNLPSGYYTIEAGLKNRVSGDPQPSNDRNSTIVHLGAGDFDGDGVADDVDNCPTAPNPDQANCDSIEPDGKLGDACKKPKIRSFAPNCGLSGGDTVTVLGSGFANIQASDITIGSVNASAVTNRSACTLEFTNPQGNQNPSGFLSIATVPAVKIPLCCQIPTINAFGPTTGHPTSPGAPGTKIEVLGCGFTGVTAVILTKSVGVTSQFPVPFTVGPAGENLEFTISANVTPGNYLIELVRQGMANVISTNMLLVQ